MKLLVITQKVDENDQLLGFFIEWLKRLAQKFDKLIVLCLEKGDYELPSNIEVVSLGKDKGYSKLSLLSTFYFLLSTHRRDYDAVFIHMNPIWVVLGGPLWKLFNKKIFFWYTHKAVTSKLRLAEIFADVIFTASKESFRLPSKKIIITGHGIDTELFKPDFSRSNLKEESSRFDLGQANHKLKILSVGRIAPVKNYETLIDAAKILKDGGVDFSVTMVGEAALDSDVRYLASLKFKVKSLKLEENFSFIGKINHNDLPQYYQSHDIFIHLSKTGSLDKVILEAMACRIKVLSSNDSARSFLPPDLIFEENNPVNLASKMMIVGNTTIDSDVREYVFKYHSLDKLIDKLSKKISES